MLKWHKRQQPICVSKIRREDLVDVLKGVSDNLEAEKSSGTKKKAQGSKRGDVVIAAHVETNALVLTAPPDIMIALQDVIAQLDIRRAQVLIEALIVEMAEGDGINLGCNGARLRAVHRFNLPTLVRPLGR